ncbi:hypothetical protein [Brumimicrobium aurantiacum]|uniref:ABC transporter ATPase n=1 Tax=Brumimicrobium aurantiacum TaxID=1737063 RepID=A0A3E1EWL1_9FLAO|nr:hypothetical protein [Brumimicrobium aurantiacum]RFC53946.1 hypothetical protein DXU93_10385 [Brumimicrobium aurantiacum]
MGQTLENLLQDFPDESRIWLYQSNKALNKEEIQKIETELVEFVYGWAAHGNQLFASAKVLNPYFILVAVNDTMVPPSGCSIDASVHKMKDLGRLLNIDFFNRMNVVISSDNEPKMIHFSELSDHKESLLYDPLISTLGELRNNWPRPIAKSSLAQMLA